MYMSLLDAVYKEEEVLKGTRLAALTHYIEMLSTTYPSADMRARLEDLWHKLSKKSKWSQDKYEALLRGWGAKVSESGDKSAWNWCAATSGGEAPF